MGGGLREQVSKLLTLPTTLSHPQGQNAGGGGGRALCIRIRLRPPPGSRRRRASGAGFLPFDDLVQTMLHELTHCVLGRHDAAFYALLDELSRECDAHRARGVGGMGAGFDAPSAGRIGGWRPGASDAVGAPVPALVRAAAAAAAERRAARGSIMPAGPRTVGGGGSDWARLSPREAAAAAAARRAADGVWCGGEGVVVEEEEDQGEIIVLSD